MNVGGLECFMRFVLLHHKEGEYPYITNVKGRNNGFLATMQHMEKCNNARWFDFYNKTNYEPFSLNIKFLILWGLWICLQSRV